MNKLKRPLQRQSYTITMTFAIIIIVTAPQTVISSASRRWAFSHCRRSMATTNRRSRRTANVRLLQSHFSTHNIPTTPGLYLPSSTTHAIHFIEAPMVAASDFAFRALCRQYGTHLTFTQMLHARNLVHDNSFRKNHLDLYEYNDNDLITTTTTTGRRISTAHGLIPAQKNLFQDATTIDDDIILPPSLVPHVRGPLIVQLAGHDVQRVVQAAQLILEHTNGNVHGIDLNCGCPQGIARKGNYGAFLMEKDTPQVLRILTALRNNVPPHVAISCKMRLPTENDQLKGRVTALLATGINFLTVHGRTLHENKTTIGACHVDQIRAVVEIANEMIPNFPIVANGGVETYADVNRIRQETGAAAVMSSEALLERPNLFTVDSSSFTPHQLLAQQLQFSRDYLRWCYIAPPLPGVLGQVGGSFNIVRGHLFKFLYRYLNEHTDLRDRLAGHEGMTNLQNAQDLIDELERRYENKSEQEMECCSQPSASWYRRHRQALTKVSAEASNQHGNEQIDPTLTVEERKLLLKNRIAKLQQQRQEQSFVSNRLP